MDPEGTNIYILELAHGKYYVGKTSNLAQRLEEHQKGNGSRWTQIHPMVKLVESFQGDVFDEDKYVKIYMMKYGIDQVRGGSYSQVKLDDDARAAVTKELHGTSDSCFRCGRDNHFVQQCYAKHHVDGTALTRHQVGLSDHPQTAYKKKEVYSRPCLKCKGNHDILICPQKGVICYRCGRTDHWKITCIETKDVNGYELEPDLLGQIGSAIKNWWFK